MATGAAASSNNNYNKTTIAAQKVYNSTKEVFVAKHKALYKKTLTILKRFTLECSFENIDESLHAQCLEIWFKSVLPLLFDTDTNVRDATIEAVAALVPQLDFTKYQEASNWSATKGTIVDRHSKEIENLRITGNEAWSRVWCLTMQILDVEIVRSAVMINQFLSIVEKGFRSNDLECRAESFVCWRVLVQIFAKHNELVNPKRIRLLSIPLKSSKSKTARIAENKFYVWWYLIAQFHRNLDVAAAGVVEPFLCFCFGPTEKPALQSHFIKPAGDVVEPAKIHPRVKSMAIVAFNLLLGINNKKILELNKALQLTVPPGPFLYTNNFNLLVKHLINSCAEATLMLADRKVFDMHGAQEMNRAMWSALMTKMDYTHCVSIAELLKDNVWGMIAADKHSEDVDLEQMIRDIIEIVGTSDQFPFGQAAVDAFTRQDQVITVLRAYCDILLHPHVSFGDSKELPSRIVKHIFTLEKFEGKPFYPQLVPELINYVAKDLVTGENRNTVDFSVVANIWKATAYTLIDFTSAHKHFCCDLEDGKKVLLDFLVWPCENIDKIDLVQIQVTFDKLFQGILKVFHNDVNEIIDLTAAQLQSVLIVKYNAGIIKVAELFKGMLRSLRCDFDEKTKPYDAFCLFEYIVKNSTKLRRLNDAVKPLVDEFIKFVVSLNSKSFFLVVMKVKTVFSELSLLKDFDMKPIKSLLLQKFRKQEFLNELRLQSSEVRWNVEQLVKMYREPDTTPAIWKNYIQKILEICAEKLSTPVVGASPKPPKPKAAEEFVVISSVWKMNPDKLTEHQREKMKERRTDIPALYNDMSQSQDTFDLKAWTPNRVVVPHTDDQDTLILMPSDSNSEATTSKGATPKDKENSSDNQRKDSDEVLTGDETAQKSSYATRHRSSADSGSPKKSSASKQPPNSPAKSVPVSPVKLPAAAAVVVKTEKVPSPVKMSPEKRDEPKMTTPSTKSKTKSKPKSALKCLHIDMNDHPAPKQRRRASSIELREKAKQEPPKRALTRKSTSKLVLNPLAVTKVKEEIVEMAPTPATEEKSPPSPRKRIDFDEKSSIKASSPKKDEMASSNNSSSSGGGSGSSKEDSLEVVESSQQNKVDSRQVAPRRSMPIVERATRMTLALVGNLSAPAAVESAAKDATKVLEDETLPLDSQAIVEIHKIAEERQTRQSAFKKPEVVEKPKSPKKAEQLEDTVQNTLIDTMSDSLLKSPEREVRKSPRKLDDTVPNTVPDAELKSPEVRKSPRKLEDTAVAAEETLLKTPDREVRKSPRKQTAEQLEGDEPTMSESLLKSPDREVRKSPRNLTEPTAAGKLSPESPKRPVSKYAESDTETDEIDSDIVLDLSPSPKKARAGSESPNLSPIAHSDLEYFENSLPHLSTSNRSIVSSPEVANETEAEMLNDTLNISPIKADNDGAGQVVETPVLKAPYSHLLDKEMRTKPSAERSLRGRSQMGESPRQQLVTKFSFGSPSTNQLRTGRGAQLLNMVMDKRNESSPKPRQAIVALEQSKGSPVTPKASMAKTELLTFVKSLPPRTASPSVSILKRKHPDDSFDNSECETPASKRKRVSFLDPPVSCTKEYHVDENEKRVNPAAIRSMINRCLIPGGNTGATESPKSLKLAAASSNGNPDSTVSGNLNPKIVLTRRSRAENMMNMVKFSNKEKESPTPKPSGPADDVEMEGGGNTTTSSTVTEMSALHVTQSGFDFDDEPELAALSSPPAFQFNNEADLLKFVCEKYKMEELVDKYEAHRGSMDGDVARELMKKIKPLIKTDSGLRRSLLSDLSEEHPEETLSYAVIENSSEVVCRSLPLPPMIDHVLAGAKEYSFARQQMLGELEYVFEDATDEQMTQFLEKLDKFQDLPIKPIVKILRSKLTELNKAEAYDIIRSLLV